MGTRPDNTIQDLYLTVRTLCRRVDFLTSRVAHLETVLEERPALGWVVLTEECYPIESGYYGDRLCETESGSPPIPDHLQAFAAHLTAGPGPSVRATRAWEGGFWCGVALRTHMAYGGLFDIGVPSSHWVIFRAPGISRPFWVQTRDEVNHILNLPGSRPDTPPLASIVVGFATITELDLFCAGGYLIRPACYQWTNL